MCTLFIIYECTHEKFPPPGRYFSGSGRRDIPWFDLPNKSNQLGGCLQEKGGLTSKRKIGLFHTRQTIDLEFVDKQRQRKIFND